MSKTAIVTGASRGIGYEIVTALAEQEHAVIPIARSAEPLQKLQQQFPEHVEAFPADITNKQDLKKLQDRIRQQDTHVDILINNAGALINKPFDEISLKSWRNMLEINVLSAVQLIKTLLSQFNRPAHIVNISSMGGFQGSDKFAGLSAYSVAKGALSILSECLAVEFADRQIKANTLCLGSVHTDMFQTAFPGLEADVSPKHMGTYIADFALNGSNFYNGKILPVALNSPS